MKLDSKAVGSRSPRPRYPESGRRYPPPTPHKVLKPHTKERSDLQVQSLVSYPPLPVLICFPFPQTTVALISPEKASSRSPPTAPSEGGGGTLPLKLGAAGPAASIVFREREKQSGISSLQDPCFCSPGSPRPPGSLGPDSSLGDRALPSAVLSHQARAKRRRHCQGCMGRGGAGGLALAAAHAPPGPASRAAEAPGRPPLLPPASCCPHRQDSELAPELLT